MGGCGNGFVGSRVSSLVAVFLLSLVLVAGTALVAGCGEREFSLSYEPQPGLCVVRVESGGGLPYPGDDLMPLFQLYGDGRCLLFQPDAASGICLQGKLDALAMSDLLRRIYEAGFFDLEDSYVDPDAYDVSYRTVSVDLVDTRKTVTVDMLSDVPTFDDIYGLILKYPMGALTEYVPEQGYLVVVKYPLESVEDAAYLDPNGDIGKLLPDMATLYRAAADHVAVAVDGATFMKLRKYYDTQATQGLYVLQPDAVVAVYPVYEPRIVDKP